MLLAWIKWSELSQVSSVASGIAWYTLNRYCVQLMISLIIWVRVASSLNSIPFYRGMYMRVEHSLLCNNECLHQWVLLSLHLHVHSPKAIAHVAVRIYC